MGFSALSPAEGAILNNVPASAMPRVLARSALLVDATSGRVLFERNPNLALPPASTTKLLTALLVYERTGLKGAA